MLISPTVIVGMATRWEFRTEDHDIGFGVTRKQSHKSKKDITLVEPRRIECNIFVEEGSLICTEPATCMYIMEYMCYSYICIQRRIYQEFVDTLPSPFMSMGGRHGL